MSVIEISFGCVATTEIGEWTIRIRRIDEGGKMTGDIVGDSPWLLFRWYFNPPDSMWARYAPAATQRASESGVTLPPLYGAGVPASIERAPLWRFINNNRTD